MAFVMNAFAYKRVTRIGASRWVSFTSFIRFNLEKMCSKQADKFLGHGDLRLPHGSEYIE
ncbi:hypothetical protein NXC24_PB00193 (plasmid) [Rhizobium sp. NXC24]|nr:hypothetical protein NXC24_PB00193 [Rhizobium sp. NXC24]